MGRMKMRWLLMKCLKGDDQSAVVVAAAAAAAAVVSSAGYEWQE